MAEKLKRSERERIIFNHLKGIEDPLYTVEQTVHGKWLVKARPIQVEEEEEHEPEPKPEDNDSSSESSTDEPQPTVRASPEKRSFIDSKHEKRKQRSRAKQDAKRILDALTHIINSPEGESSDEDEGYTPRAPPLVEQNNYKPAQVSFKRRRLAF